MAKFKSKAEQAFETKFAAALEARDFPALEKLFHQYGCYLELIDSSVSMTQAEAADTYKVAAKLQETS